MVKRTVDFIEHLLPALGAPQVAYFHYLSLDFSCPGSPQSWVLSSLEKLLSRFHSSTAELYIIMTPAYLDSALFTLLSDTGKTAFSMITLELVDTAQQRTPSYVSSTLSDVVMITGASRCDDVECLIWTQPQARRKHRFVPSAVGGHKLYFVSAHTVDYSLFRRVSEAASVTLIEVVPPTDHDHYLTALQHFRALEEVCVNLQGSSLTANQTLSLLRDIILAPSVTVLQLSFGPVRPTVPQLLLLHRDSRWATGIRTFMWSYIDESPGQVSAAAEDAKVALIEAEESWRKVFTKDRDAELRIYSAGIWETIIAGRVQ